MVPSSSPVQDTSLSRIKHEFKSRWDHHIGNYIMNIYRPKLATSPRPDNRPFYIKDTCPKCEACLILAYKILDPNAKETEIFHDEWICPNCPEKVCYLDWPEDGNRDVDLKSIIANKHKNFYN